LDSGLVAEQLQALGWWLLPERPASSLFLWHSTLTLQVLLQYLGLGFSLLPKHPSSPASDVVGQV